ncbi:unnamed protein product [Mytilus coruscus]|uniref:Peptidase M28 domain-containing protein n=1 Tax=Mytilus coruscus TaxID=42192 RepID=A0A6J8AVE8_MYTCO|nr:unnamed protein product [Mytilus coruscus]
MVSFEGRHVFIYCLCSWIYVEAADLDYIESSIKNYFSDTRHHVINNHYKMASRDYIYKEFSSFGLVAEYFEFSLPPVSTKSNFTTVIGMLKGNHFGTAYDKMIAISAHYDTVNTTKETFSSVSKDNYKGDFLAMVYRNPTSDLVLANMFKAKWKEANREHFELESFPLPFEEYNELPKKQQLNYRYFMNSDHANFWDYEVPAIYLTDTFIYRGVMTTCYHKPCDDVSMLLTDDNLKFLCKTADVLTMTINQLSDPFQGTNEASRCNQQTLWIILIYIISTNRIQFL